MTRNDAIAAVRASPKNPMAWARLGTYLAEAGDAEKATECFVRALRIDGSCAEAQSGLAALHRVKQANFFAANPPPTGNEEFETRAWSPMTHILLAANQLTLDELRAMEAEAVFGATPPLSPARLSWMLLAGFPLALWAMAAILYTLTPLARSLAATAPAARYLALGSLAVALLVILTVATYSGRRLGGPGLVHLAPLLRLHHLNCRHTQPQCSPGRDSWFDGSYLARFVARPLYHRIAAVPETRRPSADMVLAYIRRTEKSPRPILTS
jgi:hypothetical protein